MTSGRPLRAAVLLALALACLLPWSLAAPVAPAAGDDEDPLAGPASLPLPDGQFFVTVPPDGGGWLGYALTDDPGGPPFWTTFQQLGGEAALGAPICRPFLLPDGRLYQATRRALLVWRPGSPLGELADALDMMGAAGLDDWLWARGIPRPAPAASAGQAQQAPPAMLSQTVTAALDRLAWLTDAPIRRAYLGGEPDAAALPLALPGALARFGLPVSRPETFPDHVTQRFQRGALRAPLPSQDSAESGSSGSSSSDGSAGDRSAGDRDDRDRDDTSARDAGQQRAEPVPIGELLQESGLLSPAVLAPDRLIGGRLVARAPRPQPSWRSDAGWGIPTPAAPAAPAASPAPPGTSPPASPPTALAASPASPLSPASPASPASPGPTAPIAPAVSATPFAAPAAPGAAAQSSRTPAAARTPGAVRTATGTAPPPALAVPGAAPVVREVVNQGRSEHVVLANEGTAAQPLAGWMLRSATSGQAYVFPAGVLLAPGAALNVHSGAGDPAALTHPPTDLFATHTNLWPNTGGTVQLLDPTGRLVHQLRYPAQ